MTTARRRAAGPPIRVGYVALADCAPLIMAEELGLYEKYGLNVRLQREAGWANIRDRVVYGELEAAHAVAGLVFACSFGWGCLPAECLTALVLNLHGNAITIARSLAEAGVHDARTLYAEVQRRSRRPVRLGVAFTVSSHPFLMRQWLALKEDKTRPAIDKRQERSRSTQLPPNQDHAAQEVEFLVVPPAQMAGNLSAGYLDGFCVGEPWNSLAILNGDGVCVATSEELAPKHPEKVLLVRRSFAEQRESEHLALVAALLEACAFCDQPQNRERITEILAQPHRLDVPIEALRRSLLGRFYFTATRSDKIPNFHVFSRMQANEPTREKANWVLKSLEESSNAGGVEAYQVDPATHFRMDLFRQAAARI